MRAPLPNLPDGFIARPARLDEVEILIQPSWAIDRLYNSSLTTTVQEFASDLQAPNFDLEQDSRAIFAPNGDCAAYADVLAEAPYVRNYLFACIHPEYEGLGLGTWLTRWGVNRLAERIVDAPSDTRFGVHSWFYSQQEAAEELLRHEGFEHERTFFEMAIDLASDDAPAIAPLPEGIVLRTFDPATDADRLFEAYVATFRDHFGYVERPRDVAYERWRHMILDYPTFDPALVTLAEAEGGIAGYTVAWHEEETPTSNGHVQHLGTMREWRRRGLARALLTRVFATFQARGAQRVMLGVDAASPTGALDLYKSTGMYVKSSSTNMRLILREGDAPGEE